jgi:hypothetical protein
MASLATASDELCREDDFPPPKKLDRLFSSLSVPLPFDRGSRLADEDAG